jgi:hypothetical protein
VEKEKIKESVPDSGEQSVQDDTLEDQQKLLEELYEDLRWRK